MTGKFIEDLWYAWKSPPQFDEDFFYLDTDYGKSKERVNEGWQ